MNIQSAIFDMDGTLVNSLIWWDMTWAACGKNFFGNENFRPDEADDKQVRTLTLRDAATVIHERYGMGESGEAVFALMDKMLRDFYANEVQLKEGVRPFLEYCRAQGVRMCIASASEKELLEVALQRCGVREFFEEIFSCADVGVGKEKPDVFLKAQAFLGTETAQTWVFEDSLTAIETATTAGFPTVGIFDSCNFGQERIRTIATHYIDCDETLMKLVENDRKL